MLAKNMYCEK